MLDSQGAAWEAVRDILQADHFARPDHRVAFVAISALASDGKPHDPVLVAEELERRGQLAEAGGRPYLVELARDTPTAANVRAYAEAVIEKARLRQLQTLSGLVQRSIKDGYASVEIAETLGEALTELQRRARGAQIIRQPLDWSRVAVASPTPRDWVVDHWLPHGTVALLAGAGGVGKTLLAQTLAICIALGYEYFDQVPQARRVLMWAGEDDVPELERRALAICKWLGVSIEALAGKLIIESYVGRDITLAELRFGQLSPTAMMTELREQIGDYRAEYVFLDSIARVFGGNENDRHQVTQFVSGYLAGACAPTGAGLCLLGHPGRSGGSEYSGSSAWEASVRSRLYLGRQLPGKEDDQDDLLGHLALDDGARYLARRKANYSPLDIRRLSLIGGVLVPERRPERTGRPSGEFAEDIVLRAVRKLAEINVHGNASSSSPEYLPKLAKQYGMLEELSDKQFAAHMRQLILAKRLEKRPVGQYANRTPKLALVEVHK